MGSVHHSIQILKLNNSEINLLSVKLQILIYDPQYIERFKKFLEGPRFCSKNLNTGSETLLIPIVSELFNKFKLNQITHKKICILFTRRCDDDSDLTPQHILIKMGFHNDYSSFWFCPRVAA